MSKNSIYYNKFLVTDFMKQTVEYPDTSLVLLKLLFHQVHLPVFSQLQRDSVLEHCLRKARHKWAPINQMLMPVGMLKISIVLFFKVILIYYLTRVIVLHVKRFNIGWPVGHKDQILLHFLHAIIAQK